MNFFKTNNSGFSMVQVIIASAMLAGLSLAFMQLTDNQNKAQKKFELRSERDILFGEITNLLRSSFACKKTLNAMNPTSFIDHTQNHNIYFSSGASSIYFANTPLLTGGGNETKYESNTIIGNLKLTLSVIKKISPPDSAAFIMILEDKKSPARIPEMTKTIDFSYFEDDNNPGTVASCSNDDSQVVSTAVEAAKQEICTELFKGNYDSSSGSCTVTNINRNRSAINELNTAFATEKSLMKTRLNDIKQHFNNQIKNEIKEIRDRITDTIRGDLNQMKWVMNSGFRFSHSRVTNIEYWITKAWYQEQCRSENAGNAYGFTQCDYFFDSDKVLDRTPSYDFGSNTDDYMWEALRGVNTSETGTDYLFYQDTPIPTLEHSNTAETTLTPLQ